MTKELALAASLMLGACCMGPVGQLSCMKTAEGEKRYADVEATEIPAEGLKDPRASDACPQIFAVRANACLALAQAEAAKAATCPPPSETARRRVDCAVDGYTKASADPRLKSDANVAENLAHALYCGAHYRADAEGVPMAREAGTVLDRLAPNARRDHLAASAYLYLARRPQLPAAQRCEAVRTAAQLADRGLAGGPTPELAAGLRSVRSDVGTVASQINGCRGV